MRLITKCQEPKEWLNYRLTPGVVFAPIPELRESLYQEQGGICAYCMRRLKDEPSREYPSNKVEHIKPRSIYPNLTFDYNNLVLCCDGRTGNVSHCDTSKGNQDLSFSPLEPHFIESLSYSSKGEIKSSNPKWDKELNEILNLNHPYLVSNRRAAREAFIKRMGNHWSKRDLNKVLQNWSCRDADGCYKEFCGIVIHLIKKKLNHM